MQELEGRLLVLPENRRARILALDTASSPTTFSGTIFPSVLRPGADRGGPVMAPHVVTSWRSAVSLTGSPLDSLPDLREEVQIAGVDLHSLGVGQAEDFALFALDPIVPSSNVRGEPAEVGCPERMAE